MSHFTVVATKIKNLQYLKQALDHLGLKYNVGEVRGYKGQKLVADLSINMGTYDIGVVAQEDGTYTFVADWWGVETTVGKYQQEIVEEIQHEYAYVCVTEACAEEGYQIQEGDIQRQEDGTIKINATKWA